MEKRERGSNILCFITLRLFRRISSGIKVKRTEILWKNIKILKMGVGKNIKLQGTLYTSATRATTPCSRRWRFRRGEKGKLS